MYIYETQPAKYTHTRITHDILIFLLRFQNHTHTHSVICTFATIVLLSWNCSNRSTNTIHSLKHTHTHTYTHIHSYTSKPVKRPTCSPVICFWGKQHKQICIRSLALSTWIISLPLDVSLHKELIRVSKFYQEEIFFHAFSFFLFLFFCLVVWPQHPYFVHATGFLYTIV